MSDLFNPKSSGDKKTLLAVVLSVVIITAGFMIQNFLFPPAQSAPAQTSSQAVPSSTASAVPTAPAFGIRAAGTSTEALLPIPALVPAVAESNASLKIDAPTAEKTYTISTDLIEATFSNRGGDLVSLKLKKHKDQAGYVDLIVPNYGTVEGLAVAFGGNNAASIKDLLNARYIDDRTIEFSRTYLADAPGKSEAVPFIYKKAFSFKNGEYLFGMAITLENSANEFLPLDIGGFAYSVKLGQQIGPDFTKRPKNSDFRKIINIQDGKRKDEGQKKGNWSPKSQPTWSGIAGKYFAFVAVPELTSYSTTYTMSATGPDQVTGIVLSRPAIKASRQSDAYYFYFGPKTAAELSKYEYSDRNAFGKQGLQLESVMDSSNLLGWLETGLKFAMNVFYKLIPNYGIAIILVTVLVKLLMFPLSKKGSVATARMSEFQPRIQEIQAKYKSNPQKMNQEMAELYKKEGYNPMSGCLPLLIQFPIFIAMYNLFNNQFDLRGASFIAGWIPDLSMPESVLNFGNFRIPLLGWNDLRALPIIYLASQLLYGKFTQTPQTGPNAAQMKLMMFGMPIMFFFILYDVPSGLLIYWIASNVLQIGQQIAINDYLKKHKAARAATGPVIAPTKTKPKSKIKG